jgi:D-aminopeptidase
VLANFRAWADLRIDGVAVGRALGRPEDARRDPAGSCIVVVATDAPLDAAQLRRVARRAGLGLARTGTVARHASGESFLAFAAPGAAGPERGERVPERARRVPDRALDPFFSATVESTEAALLNALWHAVDTTGATAARSMRCPATTSSRSSRGTDGRPHDRGAVRAGGVGPVA